MKAMVFDTDGVITDSARVHAAAWKEAFDAYMDQHPPPAAENRRPFDVRGDYLAYVDGKSRLDGAHSFLISRGYNLPRTAVQEVAAAKDELFRKRLRDGGITAFPGTVRFLRVLHGAGMPMAAASASRHARELLSAAGVLDFFAALVDGGESARLGLTGKPDPALFLEAARRLGIPPAGTAVAEDALAGVEAGRRGGFGLVIGVNRTATTGFATQLRQHGADVVVADLADLLDDA
ncbi:HAD-IA family hydrolase [Streptomyces sp. AM8-1-1]|uniref:HAD-IA family hydrolase n=1 Tax=Streptomyces sp. AM8-1-1 TaxID=3075825 RepID=UPI0028C477D3|nr:HAD-IA family hydrolase [Streptomyces sp. AM8-1-1]WNO77009.1 HAD-IA family hydrolase [Streptomyces sp. AM8-1-1]